MVCHAVTGQVQVICWLWRQEVGFRLFTVHLFFMLLQSCSVWRRWHLCWCSFSWQSDLHLCFSCVGVDLRALQWNIFFHLPCMHLLSTSLLQNKSLGESCVPQLIKVDCSPYLCSPQQCVNIWQNSLIEDLHIWDLVLCGRIQQLCQAVHVEVIQLFSMVSSNSKFCKVYSSLCSTTAWYTFNLVVYLIPLLSHTD